jgi:hypothetical protein
MAKSVLRSLVLLIFIFTGAAYSQSPASETKQMEIFGQKIYYLESGSASNPTVILPHGLDG